MIIYNLILLKLLQHNQINGIDLEVIIQANVSVNHLN